MADLLARVLARVDQLDALARTATPGPWTTSSYAMLAAIYKGNGHTLIYDEGGHTEDDAAHIIAWDPPTVLALCAGARRLLDGHVGEVNGGELVCAACSEHGGRVWPCGQVVMVAEMLRVDVG